MEDDKGLGENTNTEDSKAKEAHDSSYVDPRNLSGTNKNVDFDINEDDMDDDQGDKDNPKESIFQRIRIRKPRGKKEWAIFVVVLIVILGLIYFLFIHKDKKQIVVHKSPAVVKNVSDLVPSTLTGLPVQPSVNKTPVTAVMIENSDQARPQAGLSQAGVVFEALTEGGITRFMALYQDTAPSNIGPVRSVRPYYLEWALGFDASIAHVGGSPLALSDVNTLGVKDLNEFYNASAYHRISTRQAPHNMYTSISDLNALEQNKGYTSVSYTGFTRATIAPAPSKTPTASAISLNPSYADFAVKYAYNSSTNSYDRSEGGAAMTDSNTGKQVSPKVVIAIVVPLSQGALDTSNAYYSVYGVLGSGVAYVFQDGNATIGHWTKTSDKSQIQFTDANGQPLPLDPGQTWITALSETNQISYSP
jgi:hypothetical protein